MKAWILGAILAFAGIAQAQYCQRVVTDDANILGPRAQELELATQSLTNQGADVRIVTLGTPTTNLDIDEKQIERSCSSWQSAYGQRKNSLIVLMVAPASHKLGIYYGGLWKNALDNHWNRIKSDYMVPHFRDKDWVGGFLATEQQINARITASKDEALHPIQATTVNQATDFSGLWTFFKWLLFLTGLGFLVWFVYSLLSKSKQKKEAESGAQLRAVQAKNEAAASLNSMKDLCTEREAAGKPVYRAKMTIDAASEDFSRLANSLSMDPSANNLSIRSYDLIASAYGQIITTLKSLREAMDRLDNSPTGKSSTPAAHSKPKHSHAHAGVSSTPAPASAPVPAPAPATAPAAPSHTYVDNSTTIIESPAPSYYEDPPVRHSSHVSSSDDDSSSSSLGGGGSSSWSDSSSSSSSSDDGGSSSWSDSSSSFDSGSSGGGSSDF